MFEIESSNEELKMLETLRKITRERIDRNKRLMIRIFYDS